MSEFKHYVIMGAGIAAGLVLVSMIAGSLGRGLKL